MGWVDVDAMLDSIPERQFIEWWQYYRLEPWGEERADMRHARATSDICNSNGARTKPDDYLIDFEKLSEPKGTENPQDGNDAVRQMIAAGIPVIFKPREKTE